MRGKISDQDLTDYAVNDGLDARERLYVESMLGVSEACREDVYRMLDLAQALEEGFEEEEAVHAPSLTFAQRQQLLSMQPSFSVRPFLRKAATTLSLAACVAIVLANPRFWQVEKHARTVAAVSSGVSHMVSEAMAYDDTNVSSWMSPLTVSQEETEDFIQTSGESDSASAFAAEAPSVSTGCTPPTLMTAGFVISQ